MNISPAGLALIQSFEKCRLQAYLPTPEDVWTVGFGHTQGVSEGDTCTTEQAAEYLKDDLSWVEGCIADHVNVELTQGQHDALCSICYNIGCTAFKGSTLLKLLNAGDTDGAKDQFRRWNRQAGKELPGLTRRRAAEAEMFG